MFLTKLSLVLIGSLVLSVSVRSQNTETNIDKDFALPQQPVAKKARTDLHDQRIKGKVQSIRCEGESLRGYDAGKGRGLSRIDQFNESGFYISRTYYGAKSVTYYGYIDGDRVTKSIGGGGSGSAASRSDEKPRDKPFDYKHRYKYNDSELTEEILISNNGSEWMTYKYKRKNNAVEVLVYDNKGKLNQKYVHFYDKNGNEIEYDVFNVFKDPNKVTLKGKYEYAAFDSNGNWTQRTLSYASEKNGGQVFEPYAIEYCTLTYFR